MKFPVAIVSSVLILLFLWAGLNWDIFIQTQNFNIILSDFEAPLGIVMLIVIVILGLVYILHVGTIETKVLIQNRNSTKTLEKARRLAEDKETSRINALNEFLTDKLSSMEKKINDILTQLEFNNASSHNDKSQKDKSLEKESG